MMYESSSLISLNTLTGIKHVLLLRPSKMATFQINTKYIAAEKEKLKSLLMFLSSCFPLSKKLNTIYPLVVLNRICLIETYLMENKNVR